MLLTVNVGVPPEEVSRRVASARLPAMSSDGGWCGRCLLLAVRFDDKIQIFSCVFPAMTLSVDVCSFSS